MSRLSHKALLGASLILPLALLTACGTDDAAGTETSSAAETPQAPTEDVTEEVAEEETEPVEIDRNLDAEAVDFGTPTQVTSPGTELALGEPAWVEHTSTYGEDEVTSVVGLSVLEIREGDPSFFSQYSNAEDFEDYTPYFIITQYQWTEDPPADQSPDAPALFPVADDGSDLEYLTGRFSIFSASDECGLRLPEYDEENRVALSCLVGLGVEGSPVAGAVYNGEGYGAFFATEGNAYVSSPLSWS